ncbi:MAG: 50S ribosomal protein L3 [Candidatus Vogelbacteria bacterium]|nr:50S ribosomal protein L3 [Candidatus Vogelbacteria bacterium]
MTQIFDAAGAVWPATIVSGEPGGLTVGDVVAVSGRSKGKGFQGVVRRYGFRGGPRTHGQKHSEREPGSIGGGLRTRVPKGMRMGGRMGGRRTTVRNLKVVAVDKAARQFLISGAVPGRRGSKLEIRMVKLEHAS